MSKKDKALEGLYDKLAEALIERITSPEATAKDFDVARNFLKDNNISAVATFGSPLAQLAENLPFDDKSVDTPPAVKQAQ